MSNNLGTLWFCALAVGTGLWAADSEAEIRSADLRAARSVEEGQWLRLKLEVLGLRLSYPAYRINLQLDDENGIVFTFMASAPMIEHLMDAKSAEAKKVFVYHAEGIGHQVSSLLKDEFPELWPRFSARDDFKGKFLGPGAELDDPPVELATWIGDKLYWVP